MQPYTIDPILQPISFITVSYLNKSIINKIMSVAFTSGPNSEFLGQIKQLYYSQIPLFRKSTSVSTLLLQKSLYVGETKQDTLISVRIMKATAQSDSWG